MNTEEPWIWKVDEVIYIQVFDCSGVTAPNLLSCSKVSCNVNQLNLPVATLKDEINFNNVFY